MGHLLNIYQNTFFSSAVPLLIPSFNVPALGATQLGLSEREELVYLVIIR